MKAVKPNYTERKPLTFEMVMRVAKVELASLQAGLDTISDDAKWLEFISGENPVAQRIMNHPKMRELSIRNLKAKISLWNSIFDYANNRSLFAKHPTLSKIVGHTIMNEPGKFSKVVGYNLALYRNIQLEENGPNEDMSKWKDDNDSIAEILDQVATERQEKLFEVIKEIEADLHTKQEKIQLALFIAANFLS